MGPVCRRFSWCVLILAFAQPLGAQISRRANSAVEFEHQQKARSTPEPTGFLENVVNGKLTLSLDDAIRLALENNTDIRIDKEQIVTAKDALQHAFGTFDPTLQASFNSTRQISPQYTELGGAPTLSSLSQATQVGVSQTLETGTNYQVSFATSKFSSNSSFFFFSPAYFTALTFNFTQPLLKGAGLFVNRAPIFIAQRGLAQSHAAFEAEVNDLLLQVISDYWNVVQARENVALQQESLDAAQKSYDRDKHALELGALPPLDIYRSESQVASRRVTAIQSEYSLKQTEDQLRRDLGADIDPNIRALDLELTEKPEPSGALMSIDIPTALEKALNYRPELESARQHLAADDANIRVARNNREPNLSLNGSYQTSGLNNITVNGNFAAGTYGDAISQMFDFGSPTYSLGATFSYPFRNRQAQAALGDALSSKRHDEYSDQRLRETITLDVANSVHQLDEFKLSMEAAKIARDLAKKTLDAEQHKYELGAETVFFVLEAQTELTQAEQNHLQAEVNYQVAAAKVDHETGRLLEKLQVQITRLDDH
jgi:outer membrane protein